MRTRFELVFIVVVLLGVHFSAQGHEGILEGQSPWVRSDGAILGGTSWGVILESEDAYQRVCDEALDAAIGVEQRPSVYALATDDMLWVGSERGLLRTETGCSYEPLHALGARRIVNVFGARDFEEPSQWLWVSSEEDQYFVSVVNAEAELIAEQPLSSTLGAGVVTGGFWSEQRNTFLLSVVKGNDESSLVEVDVTVNGENEGLDPLSSTEIQTSILFSSAKPLTLLGERQGRVLLFSYGVDTLGQADWSLLELDENFNLEEDVPINTLVTAYVERGAFEYWWLDANRVVQVGSGHSLSQSLVRIEDVELEPFSEQSWPARCLIDDEREDRVWTCGQLQDFNHFRWSTDGMNWVHEAGMLETVEYQCPQASDAFDACAYLFTDAVNAPANSRESSVEESVFEEQTLSGHASNERGANQSELNEDAQSDAPQEDEKTSCASSSYFSFHATFLLSLISLLRIRRYT